jgi:uncharacterized protein (TIGR02246 family)
MENGPMDGDDRNRSVEETEVRSVVENWMHAVRRRDMAAILRNHVPDILMFDVPPPFQSKGLDAYRKTWELFFSWSSDPTVFDAVEMNVTAGRDVAFVTAAMRCAGGESTGEFEDVDFRLTIGLRKLAGQWMIVHEHHSIPASQ